MVESFVVAVAFFTEMIAEHIIYSAYQCFENNGAFTFKNW